MLIAPFAALVLALATVLGWLSYRTGAEAVDSVAGQLLLETAARIGQAIERHVVGSRAVLDAAFPPGLPAPERIDSDVAALRTRLWIATSLHTDPNHYVYYGNRHGQFIGVLRVSPEEGELRLKLRAEEPRRLSRFVGIGGREQFLSQEARVFEPRERPWYKAAEAAGSHTWTAVYIDFRTQALVATRARKVVSASGEMQGVVATDVALKALNDFVGRLQLSANGIAFIIEPGGELIASSVGANITRLADGRSDRLKAAESGSALVESAYAEVRRALDIGNLKLPQSRRFTGADGPVYVAFDRVRDDAGLDWLAVVAVPQRDFAGQVTDNVIRAIVLSMLAVLLAVVLGAVFYAWVANDLRRLTAAARRIGDGELDAPIGIERNDEIGELARGFETMQQRLRTDRLTGLANREALTQRIEALIGAHSLAQPRRFAVLFVDLDGFKQVNDEFGHDVGDRVLIDVAARLRACVRENDLVARYAGDEFAILLADLPDRDAAERIRTAVANSLAQPPAAGEQASAFAFTGSVGLAIFPGDGDDAATVLKLADRDMYARKSAVQAGGDSGYGVRSPR